MVKKISTLALAALIAVPGLALAAEDSAKVNELEQQMQAMQKEIAALKNNKGEASMTGADWTQKVSLSGQVRFRGYNLQNVWDFNNDTDFDNWDVFRLKGSLKATVKATDDVTAVIQVSDQTYGENVAAVPVDNLATGRTSTIDNASDNLGNKVFLDNAYIEARNIFHLPIDMTFGRQNLIYGSGFVILDGQSQFASTSIYFDGVKLRYHITDKMTLDGLYMKDQENNRDNGSNDDITLGGAYFTYAGVPVIGKTEIYGLNRHDQNIKKDIWMYGARFSNKMDNGIDYSLEAAMQTGDAGTFGGVEQDQEALGAKLEAGYTFGISMAPRLYAGYALMTGDDPTTNDKNEGWDVFYGGWPQFGDLLAWKYVNIGPANSLAGVYDYNKLSTTPGEAVYSNLEMITIGASAKLMQDLSANFSYSMLSFDETYAGVDDDFGDYYQLTVKYQYNKQLSFSLYGAMLSPGDAFNGTPKDDATEIYWETDFKF